MGRTWKRMSQEIMNNDLRMENNRAIAVTSEIPVLIVENRQYIPTIYNKQLNNKINPIVMLLK